MAMTKQSLTITKPDDFLIAISNQTFTVSVGDIKKRRNGQREVEDLLFQMEIVLAQAGLNPNNASLAAMKAAIEAQTYWW